jgi:formylglycine-generating enzyme required for sulfatase activity
MTATASDRSTLFQTSLRRDLASARSQTDRLFEIIDGETLYERPIADRHRLIFYLGHLEAFDWNLVCRGSLGIESFHATFDRLFAFGIDPAPGAASSDTPRDWPRINEIRSYNAETRRRVDESIENVPPQVANIAIEHRLMHAETFAYLLHNLPHKQKRAAHQTHSNGGASPDAEMIDVPGGRATLGQRAGEFGWDNEFAEHTVEVPAFRMSRYKVTNGDYLRFVKDGGSPSHFWTRAGDAWLWRGMFENLSLPLDWPVYVTHEQACAYAAWSGAALPTEAQFHRAAYGSRNGSERTYPWGSKSATQVSGNFDFRRWDPEPVTAGAGSESALGISQLIGNGWEWTCTVFEPFAGFEPYPLYSGYSQPFFDGRHFVLKGGSPRTAACLLRRSFRNWFRREYPYVYGSFRLAQNR